MLNNAGPRVDLDKGEYNAKIDMYEEKLIQLQQRVKELGIPVVIMFDGWSAAGKGTLISKALGPLDRRLFRMHSMEKITEDQLKRPFLWSYAVRMPQAGRIAIFDKSYYMTLMPDNGMVRHNKISENEILYDIKAFETQLFDSGVQIIKFFLHITKDEQSRRLKDLVKSEDTKWRVTDKDLLQNKEYNKNYELFNNILKKTNNSHFKWIVLNANDRRSAALGFFEHVTERIEAAISEKEKKTTPRSVIIPTPEEIPDILSGVDLTKELTDDKFGKLLRHYQQQLSTLGYKLYRKRRSVIIVYEGWDASGKGGNIKRLTQEIDPRGYDVIPIAAPTAEELSRHYLWRFWRAVPKDGHITIYDRSWYGRVLVERIEGFCDEESWRRAFKEINDMELHMHRHGVIIFKFWLHISADEQLARFQARVDDPLKSYKICDEDWRNRDKWDSYYQAVNEMLHRTSTPYAPWLVVESESKKFARVKVLEHVAHMLEKEI